MKEFTYKVTDEVGLHARPAGLLVKEAAKFSSKITIVKNDKSADAKKLFALMGLGVKRDDEITVKCDGEDEEMAANGLQTFLKENL